MRTKREISLTPEQVGELAAPVLGALLKTTPENAQHWIGHKRKLTTEILRVLNRVPNSTTLTSEWEKFYLKVFSREIDLSSVVIPTDLGGFGRVIIVAQDVTSNQALKACRDRFPVYSWSDELDTAVPTNDRVSTSSYAVRIRDRVEADEELKNKSANDLASEKIQGITLLERLIYELKYNEEVGKHLDLKNITECAGSRNAFGYVPDVRWYGDKLYVSWTSPVSRHDDLRARAVVSV